MLYTCAQDLLLVEYDDRKGLRNRTDSNPREELTRNSVLEVIHWSFEVMRGALTINSHHVRFKGSGRFPTHDPWGQAFADDYCRSRWKCAGQELAGGFRGCFAGLVADQEYLTKLFPLQSYSV